LRNAAGASTSGAGLAAFFLLSIWTVSYVSSALLNWALGFYLLFAILQHGISHCPAALAARGHAGVVGPSVPLIALVLVMITVMKLPDLGWLVWLCILALDVVVFALALVTASVLAIIGAFGADTGGQPWVWLFKVPAVRAAYPADLLVVIGGFALVFFAVGVFAADEWRSNQRRWDGPARVPITAVFVR